MRDLAPDFAEAVAANEVSPAMLVFLDFEGQPLRCWTGVGPLQYGGHEWLGFGTLGGVDPVEEYSDIRAGQVTMTLTGVPNNALSDLVDLTFKRRAAEIRLALFVGDTPTLIGVEMLMRGTMDTMKLTRNPQGSTIKLGLTNELARLKESWGSLYTDAHQRSIYPDDTSLRFVPSMQDLIIKF